jgi:hypothetical protein
MSNDSALCGVGISGGLPRRLSRAVTTAACCLLRRSSAALTACRGQRTADLSMPVVAYRPATPAHRPPGAGAGVRSKRRRPEPAWRELKPQRRALSQAQARIRRVGSAPSRRRPGNASAAQRPTPPRQLSRRGRSILPHPSRRRQPARAIPPGPPPHGQAPAPTVRRHTSPGPANTGPQQLRGILAQPRRRKATAQQG